MTIVDAIVDAASRSTESRGIACLLMGPTGGGGLIGLIEAVADRLEAKALEKETTVSWDRAYFWARTVRRSSMRRATAQLA